MRFQRSQLARTQRFRIRQTTQFRQKQLKTLTGNLFTHTPPAHGDKEPRTDAPCAREVRRPAHVCARGGRRARLVAASASTAGAALAESGANSCARPSPARLHKSPFDPGEISARSPRERGTSAGSRRSTTGEVDARRPDLPRSVSLPAAAQNLRTAAGQPHLPRSVWERVR